MAARCLCGRSVLLVVPVALAADRVLEQGLTATGQLCADPPSKARPVLCLAAHGCAVVLPGGEPFRKGIWKPGRSRLFAIAGGATACLLALSALTLLRMGMPERFPPNAVKIAAYADYQPGSAYRQSICFLAPKDPFSAFSVPDCLHANGEGPRILLLGDSMAAHLYPGLRNTFPTGTCYRQTPPTAAPSSRNRHCCKVSFQGTANGCLR